MKKIKFNTNCKSKHFVQYFELLQSDYDLYRKKHFSNLCLEELNKIYTDSDLSLTHSATGALEMVATLLDIIPGDEIIMPSFTFVSTANAFVGKGAVPVFVDIKTTDFNIDETLIEQAITSKTKAIVAVHYGGHSCNLKALKIICDKYGLFLIEDAAMGFGSSYNGQPLGSYGDFGVISFDITKHISAIQGGLLLVNNKKFVSRAKNIYHIGTNRDAFRLGEVPYYEWIDVGSKYQMNELNAAFLYEQLLIANSIIEKQKAISSTYFELLEPFEKDGRFKLMHKDQRSDNVHAFYMILNSESEREKLRLFLLENNIEALFHYTPLHISPMGLKFGRFMGNNNSENISKRLLRLPMHGELKKDDLNYIAGCISKFFMI